MKRKTQQKLFLMLFLFWTVLSLQAQNQVVVNVVVPPPYSPDISYYTDNPGRLLVSLVNTTSQELEVYLHGSFMDADGIGIKTRSEYKPSSFLTLAAMGTYSLSLDELAEVFSSNDLQYVGVDMNEIIKNQGLPEGMYRICMQVFDFATNQALSTEGNGCSNYFPVQYVEPPTIITPICGDSILESDPQNIVINWTVPQGVNSMNIVYHLRMVEMFPSERDPNDALQSAGHPDFLEITTNINTYIITANDPELMAGRSYAFEVKAEDQDGNLLFLNDGVSEACWFKYKANLADDFNIVDGLSIETESFIGEFDFIPTTHISGRLFTKLPEDGQVITSTGTFSMDGNQTAPSGGEGQSNENSNQGGNSNNSGQGNNEGGLYQGFVNSGIMSGGNLNINNLSFNGMGNPQGFTFLPPLGKGLLNPQTVNVNGAVPLKNVAIRLILRPLVKQSNGFYKCYTSEDMFFHDGDLNYRNSIIKDLYGNEIPRSTFDAMQHQILATGYTDDDGNFSFDFQGDFFTGPIYDNTSELYGGIALKIEVVRAEFCSPDVDIYAMPGDDINLGDELALFNTYDAKLKVESDSHYPKQAIEPGKPIPGAIVSVYRKKSELGEVPEEVISYEGNQTSKLISNAHGEFLELFTGQTNSNGEITLQNLMYHRKAKPNGFYHLRARTRAEDPSHEEDNTLYNYEEQWRYIDLSSVAEYGMDPHNTQDNSVDISQLMKTNHEYTKKTFTSTFVLAPNPPEIKGRVMAQSNLENVAIPNAKVELFTYPLYGADYGHNMLQYLTMEEYMHIPGIYSLEESGASNASGYFRFTGLNVDINEYGDVRGPYRRLLITADGYKPFVYPPFSDTNINVKDGELVNIGDIQLEATQKLKGEVVDYFGNAVPAYVRILPNNPYYKTEEIQGVNFITGQPGAIHQYFEMASPETNIHLEVMPLSNQYFPLDTTLAALPNNSDQRIVFKVHKKMHRLHLLVENSATNAGLANVQVVIGDTMAYGTTNAQGIIELQFPSPGEQFIVKLSADGYSPTQNSLSIPVSKEWTNKLVFMKPAISISGIVTEKNTHQPIHNALVFVELQSSDGQTVYVESHTGQDGKYTLSGIPTLSQTVKIHAVKDGKNPSYIGQVKTFTLEPFAMPPKSYDLQIREASTWDFSNIWGVPVCVESFANTSGGRAKISGYFHDLPSDPIFSTLNKDEKLYFSNVVVKKDANAKVDVPMGWVLSESYAIPVKIKGGFTGDFRNFYQQKINIQKKQNLASIRAPMKLDLASFKFAYDFSGELFMDDDTLTNGGINIEVFKGASENGGNQFYFTSRYIVDADGFPISDFRVFGFNASSDYKGSYYQNGKINLQTYLHTDIPLDGTGHTMDLNINAGKIEITKEDINMIPNNNSLLSFDLEKWKVHSTQSWYFDKTKDAIIVPKATIFTGAGVDADIKGLNIRPNMLIEGEIDMSGGGLSLGGVVPLEINPNVEPMFNYDAGLGHYRISMVGNNHGLPAATVSNLPAINKALEFSSIGMLSDGSNVLNLYQKVQFYNVLHMTLSQIMTGDGFFQLAGTPNLNIPGFVPTRAIMTYKKENGQIKAEIEPLDGSIDCNRNVVFSMDMKKQSQHIEQDLYSCYGDIHIKPSSSEGGEEFTLRGFLQKTPNNVHIEVIKVDQYNEYKGQQPQKFYTGEHFMNVFEGDLAVQNSSWQELWYKANSNSQGLSNENVSQFVVHGAIDVNSEDIKVDKIDIPGVGKLSMVYLFDEEAMVGHLTIDHELQMGFGSVTSGEMESRFDPYGFYMALKADLRISSDIYKGGFIIGVYEADLTPVTNRFLSEFGSTPPDFSSMHGFYLIGRRELVNEHFFIPTVPPIEIVAFAYAEANVYLDFDQPKFSMGGYLYAYGKGGRSYLGCYIGAEGEGVVEIHGGYIKPEGVYFDANGKIVVKAGACGLTGCIGVKTNVHLSTGGSCTSHLGLAGCGDMGH